MIVDRLHYVVNFFHHFNWIARSNGLKMLDDSYKLAGKLK
jgi:hypothetical protein